MAWNYFYKEVLPFTAMITVECANVGITTLFKAATLKGMSYYVFVTYTYAIAALLISPLLFIFLSSTVLPSRKLPLISRICFLVLIGFLSQMCGYKGIEYSSPILASALSNLNPAFTFILAIIFRMERVALRSTSTQAKIIGTIVSISGALVIVLYKGPTVFPSASSLSVLDSSQAKWIIGGLLLSWRLRPSVAVVNVLYSKFCAYMGLTHKGACLHSGFQASSIAIAAIISSIFLGEALHLGSVIGATILFLGFYALIWGKARESTIDDSGFRGLAPLSHEQVPLLQSCKS